MNKIRFALQALILVSCTLIFASFAQAQATRTWVSGVGDDANPCSRTAPCKTFAGAISKTFINGEIDALDPGGFGAVTITKSITLDGTGTFASVLASGTNGINISIAVNSNDPFRTVRIRGLSITGTGASGTAGTRTGINGININTNGAAAIFVEDTVISDFGSNGINWSVTAASGAAKLFVRNVVIRNCTADGLRISSSGEIDLASLDNVESANNGNGINMGAHSRLTARNCTFATNTTAGVNHTAADSESTLFHCSISNNPTGVAATNGISRISDNMIYGNSNGITGNVKSWGNNYIGGNTTDGTPVAPNLTQT
jgi:Right handed beta helix region